MCIEISAGFMLMVSLLWLLDTSGILSAMLPAVLIHELGHVLALAACGARVSALRMEACGLRMDYWGSLGRRQEIFCALSGPAAGLLYALAAAFAGRWIKSEFLLCSGGISAALTAFNLLPAPMLDGGRVLSLLLKKVSRLPGLLTGGALLGAGAALLGHGVGAVVLAAGIWVVIGTCKYPSGGIQ